MFIEILQDSVQGNTAVRCADLIHFNLQLCSYLLVLFVTKPLVNSAN